jgi:cysteine desulfurase
MKSIYLDHAATTGVSEAVRESMEPYFKESFGNPSSLHSFGIPNRKIINESRVSISQMLECEQEEIFFTSSGSESINWAIKGTASAYPDKRKIISTKIEHHATLHTLDYLEALGYDISYVNVDEFGFVDLKHLDSLLCSNTLLVSIIYANNEIGTIQNIHAISQIVKQHNCFLHLDAVQALCHIPFSIRNLNVDLISFSGHKFHAPKGVGLLYKRKTNRIDPLIHGGDQEYGHRAGTENVAFIKGIETALREGLHHLEEYQNRLNSYSKYVINALNDNNIDFRLNGPSIDSRLPGHLSLAFRDLDGHDISFQLNRHGFALSTTSACDSKSILPSHVLRAINVDKDYIKGTIRISFGLNNTMDEVVLFTDKLIELLKKVH